MTNTSLRTLVGYADKLSVRPGEQVAIKVSRYGGPDYYQADLVRVHNGDAVSHDSAFRIEPVPDVVSGKYSAKHQPQHFGSYVEISASDTLDQLDSFTLQAAVQPSYLPAVPLTNLDADAVPGALTKLVGEQTVLARWNDETQTGWSLVIDETGHPMFRLGDGAGKLQTVKLKRMIKVNQWCWLTVRFDHTTNILRLDMQEVGRGPGAKCIAQESFVEKQLDAPLVQLGLLRFGAASGAASNRLRAYPVAPFNGRLDCVRLSNRRLSSEELIALRSPDLSKQLKNELIGDWNFSLATGTSRVLDESSNNLHGVAVNLPMRAVRGVHWNGTEFVFKNAPQQYSAIHFHSDDIYDVEWQTDFEFTVPDNLPSGIYAVRLQHGDFTDYVTLFVAPPKGKVQSKVALLMSTSTYLAYSNVTMAMEYPDAYPAHYTPTSDYDFMHAHPHFQTGGIYHRHVDGTQYSFSSRLRPILNLKPGGLLYNFNLDTLISEWLEHELGGVDIVTDELLNADGEALLEDYQVLITCSHPEYVSTIMLDAIESHIDNGGRLMYLGGNGFFWNTPFHSELEGVIECRWEAPFGEKFNEFDGTRSGLWWESNRSPEIICGVSTTAMIFNGASAYKKQPSANDPRVDFIFQGIDDELLGDFGIADKAGAGAVGLEVDGCNYMGPTPSHALVIARCDDLKGPVQQIISSDMPVGWRDIPDDRPHSAFCDMVFFETMNGGAVFSTGSIAYAGALRYNDFKNNISQLTANVLHRFSDPSPFDLSLIETSIINPVRPLMDDHLRP